MTDPLTCLAIALYFEARSESMIGQFAVAEVIMNRVEDGRFGDDVCAVITQDRGAGDHDCQFSFWCDGLPDVIDDQATYDSIRALAYDVIMLPNAPDVSYGALYYHTTDVSPSWSRNLQVTMVEGNHIFFTDVLKIAANY